MNLLNAIELDAAFHRKALTTPEKNLIAKLESFGVEVPALMHDDVGVMYRRNPFGGGCEVTPAAAETTLTLPGLLAPWQQTLVHPQASGYVKRTLVDLGDVVSAGQVLAEIDTPALDQQLLAARARLAQAEAQLALARSNDARSRKMVGLGIVSQQRADQEQRLGQDVRDGPEEVHALEEAQEQRRVAQRCERATGVGDDEDEEDHHMRLVPAVVVGADQGPDQEHGGAGRAHEAGQHRAQAQDGGVESRAAMQVAADVDAPRNGEQRGQQDDEGDVLGQQRVHHVLGDLEKAIFAYERANGIADAVPVLDS